MSKALVFNCIAPQYSWGISNSTKTIKTNLFPSHSAIVGLIRASLGLPADNNDNIPFLSFTSYILKPISYNCSFLSDFHTIGGGYKDTSKRRMLKDSSSLLSYKFKTTATLTNREYVQDVIYIISLTGDPSLLNQIKEGLLNPKWGIWFGRKSCLPSKPLNPRFVEEVDHEINSLATEFQYSVYAKCTTTNNLEDISETFSDSPLKPYKAGPRKVKIVYYDIPKTTP